MQSLTRLTAAAAMLAVATITNAAEKRVIYVDKSAPPGGDGSSWQKAFRDPHDAFERVSIDPGGEIDLRIAGGIYRPAEVNQDRWKTFTCRTSLSPTSFRIQGSFAGRNAANPDRRDYNSTPTILSGDLLQNDGPDWSNREDNSIEILNLKIFGRIEIDGITIRGAAAYDEPHYSSGLTATCDPDTLDPLSGGITLSNCVFERNEGGFLSPGGALLNCQRVFILDCEFSNNKAPSGNGGGLRVNASQSSAGAVQRCVFDGNSANFGGALFGQKLEVSSSEFVENAATMQGGAVFGARVVTTSFFLRNRAESSGGAIAGSPYSIRSCTLIENQAPLGGAIYTVNTAIWFDSNIVWADADYPMQTVRFADCVDVPSLYRNFVQGGRDSIEITGFQPWQPPDVLTADPMFIRPSGAPGTTSDWRTWSYRLRTQSPAVGGGSRNWANATDPDGRMYRATYNGPTPDAGCYFITRTDCAGNLDRNWPEEVVDDSDFQLFAAAYDLTIAPPANPLADFNNDGLVDDADFSLFAVAYDALLCP